MFWEKPCQRNTDVFREQNSPTDTTSSSQEILEITGAIGFHILATTREMDVVPTSLGWCSIPVLPMNKLESLRLLEKCSCAAWGPEAPAFAAEESKATVVYFFYVDAC